MDATPTATPLAGEAFFGHTLRADPELKAAMDAELHRQQIGRAHV